MKRKLRYALLAILAILVIIQFIRPEKNLSGDNTYDVSTKYSMTHEVKTLLHNACYNCHSNKSEYPWYSNIQPVAWWLQNHIDEGKEHLNFSEFTNRRIAVQNHKLEEVIELVEKKEMPLKSYTWFGLHPEANITDAQRQVIIDWAKEQMDKLAAEYPADSLVMRRR